MDEQSDSCSALSTLHRRGTVAETENPALAAPFYTPREWLTLFPTRAKQPISLGPVADYGGDVGAEWWAVWDETACPW